MKDIDLVFIIALIIIFFFPADVVTPTPRPSYQANILMAEGFAAIAVNNTLDNTPDVEPIVPTPLCDCNGTGKVKTPDGITDITCPCGSNCKCGKPSPEPNNNGCKCGNPDCKCGCQDNTGDNIPVAGVFEKDEIHIMDEQILYFGAQWCAACKITDVRVKPQLVAGKWGMNLDRLSYIKPIDVEKYPELAEKYEVEVLPTWVMLHKGKVVAKLTGYQTVDKITDLFYKNRMK